MAGYTRTGSGLLVPTGAVLGSSSNSTDFSTSSTTFVDVTSLTFVANVQNKIKFVFSGTVYVATAAGLMTLQIVEDSTNIPFRTHNIALGTFYAFHAEMLRTPTPGQHTYKFQAKIGAGGGTLHIDGTTAGTTGPTMFNGYAE